MFKVDSITTLGWQRDKEVQEIFAKVCKQIQPILTKREWNVGALTEFYPSDPNLLGLNINRGTHIKIRCRLPHDKNSFFEFNHIIGTVLHELAHNSIGPHNAAFQKLWDELWDELENFQRNGIEGFDKIFAGCGCKLSTEKHNPITTREAKKIALKAAEKRKRNQELLPVGGHKIGGSRPQTHKSPKELAAEAALLRDKKSTQTRGFDSPI